MGHLNKLLGMNGLTPNIHRGFCRLMPFHHSVVVFGPVVRCDSYQTCKSADSSIESLDPFLERSLSLESGFEAEMIQHFPLERALETLGPALS